MPRIVDVVQRPKEKSQRKNHVLYVPAKKVTEFNQELHNRVDDLIETMHHEEGIGIAAPQVGWSEQIFIIEAMGISNRYPHPKKYATQLTDVPQQIFINPRIVEASDSYVTYWHGCLSCKGLDRSKLRTYKDITVTAQDLKGNVFTRKLDKLASIIFQHEFRHLLGTLYIDHGLEFLSLESLREKLNSGDFNLYLETNEKIVPHLLKDYTVGESIEDYSKKLT